MTEDRGLGNVLSVLGSLDVSADETELRFADGRVLRLPTMLLEQGMVPGTPPGPAEAGAVLIPIVEEQLTVGKRVVETGTVRLHKGAELVDVKLDEPLAVTTWQVERVARHEVVAEAPAIRQEGETTVYPIVEERLIITKELLLVEEVHVTRAVSERRDTQTVTLRRETLSVERAAAVGA